MSSTADLSKKSSVSGWAVQPVRPAAPSLVVQLAFAFFLFFHFPAFTYQLAMNVSTGRWSGSPILQAATIGSELFAIIMILSSPNAPRGGDPMLAHMAGNRPRLPFHHVVDQSNVDFAIQQYFDEHNAAGYGIGSVGAAVLRHTAGHQNNVSGLCLERDLGIYFFRHIGSSSNRCLSSSSRWPMARHI